MSPPRAAAALLILLASCRGAPKDVAPAGSASSAAPPAASAGAATSPSSDGGAAGRALPREGSAIARSLRGDALYVADEDHRVLRTVALPLDPKRAPVDTPLPGAPAQLVVAGERVLVTIRDPGLLLVLRPDDAGLVEVARVPLPADAWGLTLTPDGAAAIVTSAWTHRVSAVDLAAAKVRWSVDVAREPRGIAVTPDGARAYVTHLMGPDLTRIDSLAAASPSVTRVHLPVAPMRAREGVPEDATLAYAAALSPDGARLFVPRQALDADGKRAWAGQPVVDVLLTADETPLAQRADGAVEYHTKELDEARSFGTGRGPFRDLTYSGGFPLGNDAFEAPRAIVHRASTRTLLVASEGTDALVELDALAVEPAAHVLRRHRLRLSTWTPKEGRERVRVLGMYDGAIYAVELDDGTRLNAWNETVTPRDGSGPAGRFAGIERRQHGSASAVIVELAPDADAPGATTCGAPSGVALSEDERTAWVFCRSTDGLAEIALDAIDSADAPRPPRPVFAKLGDDPLPAEAALGRRLFYDADDGYLSGGMACAGCHPEGRDDGHVWSEVTNLAPGEDHSTAEEEAMQKDGSEPPSTYLSAPIFPVFFEMVFKWALVRGHPRQTPMLAGRVDARGPYGWHGRSPDLVSRILRGATLHRWSGNELFNLSWNGKTRAVALAAFVRQGLVPPPREARPLTAEEERGKAVFEDAKTGCTTCHVPATGYTDRGVVPFAAPPPVFTKAGPAKGPFVEDVDRMFKTPSLLFVGGTPPYFHDGSAATLEEAIEKNHDRMGKTSHLSPDERAALAAFLRTL
jgi:cytochrome c peroxidase